MHVAMLMAALVVGGDPCADYESPCYHYARQPGLMERIGNRTEYCYWACHGASYQQWPNYNYRMEFDYAWFAYPRPSMWLPPCAEPEYMDLPVLPPEELDPAAPEVMPFSSATQRPPVVTRIEKRLPAAVR